MSAHTNRPGVDFILGLIGGPFIWWILFWCACVLRGVILSDVQDASIPVAGRVVWFLFGVVKYAVIPVLLIVNMSDRPALLGGVVIGGGAAALWLHSSGDKPGSKS